MKTICLTMDDLTPRWTPLRFHPVQSRLFHEPMRFKQVPAARRTGKTEMAKRKLAGELITSQSIPRPWLRPRWFAAAPTRDQAKRIWWNDMKALTPKRIIREVRESDLCIVANNGAELWVIGLDRPQRMEGVSWDGGCVDEFADCKPGIFDAHIRPAIADRQGWCWLLGVPDRDAPGQVEYRDRYDRILAGAEPEWAVYHWPSADILPPEEVESARRSMDPELFRQEFLGEFVLAGGLAFGDFDPVIHVRECRYDPALPVAWALDFNVNPMCSGVMQRKDGRAYVLHEFALADTNTETACTAFIEWAAANKVNLKGVGIYGDASGGARKTSSSATDWEIVRSHLRNYSPRFLVPRANHPIKDTLNSVRAKLRNADGEATLFIDPQAKTLIKDLRSLLWPSDLSDGHAAAWLRYYIHTEFPVRGGAAGPIIGGRVLA